MTNNPSPTALLLARDVVQAWCNENANQYAIATLIQTTLDKAAADGAKRMQNVKEVLIECNDYITTYIMNYPEDEAPDSIIWKIRSCIRLLDAEQISKGK